MTTTPTITDLSRVDQSVHVHIDGSHRGWGLTEIDELVNGTGGSR